MRARFGSENLVASDIKQPQVCQSGAFPVLDAMDRLGMERIIEMHGCREG